MNSETFYYVSNLIHVHSRNILRTLKDYQYIASIFLSTFLKNTSREISSVAHKLHTIPRPIFAPTPITEQKRDQ